MNTTKQTTMTEKTNDPELRKIADDFRKGMQEIADEHQTTIAFETESGKTVEFKPQGGPDPSLLIAKVKLPPIHLACLKDDIRPNHALIEIENGIAQATNGVMIARVDLRTTELTVDQMEMLEGKYIHMEAWKEAHKCDTLQVDDGGLHITKNGITKHIDYSEPNGQFFTLSTIIKDLKEKGQNEIGIMAVSESQLDIASRILETDVVVLSFSGEKKGMVLMPGDGSDGRGVILMPASTEGTVRKFV